METLFKIPEANQEAFLADAGKLSKRAVKLGFAPFTPVVVDKSIGVYERPDGEKIKYTIFHYIVKADAPRLKGWTFIATLDHSEEANIVRCVPNTGLELPSVYRNARPVCDHCKVNRYRRDTFVIHHAEKGFMQIGRNCLKDFFGNDPMALGKYASLYALFGELVQAMEDYEFGGGLGGNYISLTTYLSHVAAMIRTNGWVSGKKAYEQGIQSTAMLAVNNMAPRNPKRIEPNNTDRDLAEKAIAWGISLSEKDELTDYEHNVVVVSGSTVVGHKNRGIAASIVSCYLTFCEKLALKTARAANNCASIGKTGDRLKKLNAYVISTKEVNGDFGLSYFVIAYIGCSEVAFYVKNKPANNNIQISGTVGDEKKVPVDYDNPELGNCNQTRLSRVKIHA